MWPLLYMHELSLRARVFLIKKPYSSNRISVKHRKEKKTLYRMR